MILYENRAIIVNNSTRDRGILISFYNYFIKRNKCMRMEFSWEYYVGKVFCLENVIVKFEMRFECRTRAMERGKRPRAIEWGARQQADASLVVRKWIEEKWRM